MIKMMLIAGAGGFAGTCSRFLIGKWTAGIYHGAFPMGTFLVNVIGCFIIGLLLGLIEKTHVMTPEENVLLITGFCGGFTTFSAFADDMWGLGHKGGPSKALSGCAPPRQEASADHYVWGFFPLHARIRTYGAHLIL